MAGEIGSAVAGAFASKAVETLLEKTKGRDRILAEVIYRSNQGLARYLGEKLDSINDRLYDVSTRLQLQSQKLEDVHVDLRKTCGRVEKTYEEVVASRREYVSGQGEVVALLREISTKLNGRKRR